MEYDELDDFKRVKFRIKDEGFHYCFVSYSDWSEVKDEEFQRLRKQYLESAKHLQQYIDNKIEELSKD